MANLCSIFQNAFASHDPNCVVDTSRNYNNYPPGRKWCNAQFGGIGCPSTASTGFGTLIEYLSWIKPAGASDGQSDGGGHTSNATQGQAPGVFYREAFVTLWNNGLFVKERGSHQIWAKAQVGRFTVASFGGADQSNSSCTACRSPSSGFSPQ